MSLVVSLVRIVINLTLKFIMYFSKLTNIICTFKDYLGPLAKYAKVVDINLIVLIVINAYINVLTFS